MKPMHHTVCKVNRCPCCHSRYNANKTAKKAGRTAARLLAKRVLRRELGQ